jgi:hypothetical protein
MSKKKVDDVLLDGRLGVNAIINELRQKVGLPLPQPTPFNLRMDVFSFNKPLGIVPNIRIQNPWHIVHNYLHGDEHKAIDPMYSMLLGRPQLHDAKMIHDWWTNMITIKGNGTVKTIFISNYLNGNIRRPQTT